ncbi:lysozyme [Rhizobium sp. 12,4]|uniref:lysozyme n=1 Tax=Rhizobium sp. 12,4 TaxID=3405135 RepID=UPI003D356165
MANRRADPVSYRPFRANPLLADGLLAVARDDGGLERKVAQGLANLADDFGKMAAQDAALAGERQGAIDAMNAGPGAATVTGGEEIGTASPNGQAGHVRGAASGITVLAGSGREQAKAILRHEEGFRETPYWDKTAWRIGYGSDTVTGADGRSVPVRPGMRITREDAERDLDYRLDHREGATARRQLGDIWERLPASVQGALSSVAYNYGSLPKEVVSAAAGGIEAIADAVRGLGSNGARRQREADLITGGTGHPSYAKFTNPAADGPVSVTPVSVRQPIQVTPGKAGGFRPRPGNSIYDRAYNVKGTNTYLQELELTMLQDQANVYDAYKDDPVQLEKAMGELLQAHMQDHVFPEIAPEYQTAFQKQAFLKVQRAKDAFDDRKRAQDRMDYLGRVNTLEDQKSQALAGLDLNDENGATVLSNLQSSIDAHYDAGVARGIISPEEAETYKRKSRSEAVTGFYVGQAQKMKADDIKAMRADMTRDYAAGELEGVTADDWDRIDKGLAAAESARRTQDGKADADLAKRGEDIAKRVARGLPVDPAEMSRFQMDASTAPKGKEIVASTLTRLKLAEAIRTLPIGEVDKALPSILGEGATPEDYDFAKKAVADQRKDLQTDPIGVAERFGILPVSPSLPLDGDVDPDAVSGAFSERINQAQAAAKHFGVTPKYFRPGEAEQIQAAVIADPDKGLSIAAGLVDAAGANADRVLAELGPAAPAVSLSGGLVAAGGDPKAARDLIAGYGKSPDGKDYPDMPNTKRIPIAQTETGNALAFTPGEINRVDAAAAAIARKRLYDAGIDPKKDDAKEVYKRAYQEAAGATFVNNVQFGGFGDYDRGAWYRAVKVVVPPSIRADKFVDVVDSLTDADVGTVKGKNGKTWTAADYQKAIPVAVKGGYAFALGDPAGSSPMFIADEKGNPVVLDIAGMRDKLQARVPEGWR